MARRPAPRTGKTHHNASWRVLGVLALMIGIIGMHSFAVATSPSMAHGPAVSGHHRVVESVGNSVLTAVDACDCHGHMGFHACVFIMTELLALAGLALLCWVGVNAEFHTPARIRQLLRRRQRAPPWTVLTLAEISLLRI